MRDVEALLRPRSVAVVGASATRRAQGNGVIRNLQEAGYGGRIIPVHPTAPAIDGVATVPAIDRLPPGIDTAIVAIPAPGVVAVLAELQLAGLRSGIVFSNGFSGPQAAALRAFAAASPMAIHGPNCMGLINLSDAVRLYPSTITAKVQPGRVALIAQSGSAAISLMNSTTAGLSKVVTMGSEFQVTAPDYMRWFATDDTTSVVGIVLESIQNPVHFAAAAAQLRGAGKALVVLKVGRSEVGAAAVQAHTGALISRSDAYDRFFARNGIPTARDYDELIASMECFATCRAGRSGNRIGIIGISGGETALACDIVAELGLYAATWSPGTEALIRTALPGVSGVNPLDLGASVHHTVAQDEAAIAAILGDEAVDQLMVVQDSQATLTPTMLGNYTPRILLYGRQGAAADKPLVIVSPTGETTHPRIIEAMAAQGVPVLRGLRAGAAAMRNLSILPSPPPPAAAPAADARAGRFAAEIAACTGPLPSALCSRILHAYGIPIVRSALVASESEALAASERIGFPMVVKINSPDIPHRSDIGGVALGIADTPGLLAAMVQMRQRVLRSRPDARIAGFELQEQLSDCIEAAAGFVAAPPFGALIMIGTGGVLVELEADRTVELGPFSHEQALTMIGSTRLGARLSGYRTLLPPTSLSPLADGLARLSELAAALCGQVVECDLNPVLVRKGSGEIRVVDALMVAQAGCGA